MSSLRKSMSLLLVVGIGCGGDEASVESAAGQLDSENPVTRNHSELSPTPTESTEQPTSPTEDDPKLRGLYALDSGAHDIETRWNRQTSEGLVPIPPRFVPTPEHPDAEIVDHLLRGSPTEHETLGESDASLDRITMEIRASQRDGRAAIVWLFDGSSKASLTAAAERVRRVVEQLAALTEAPLDLPMIAGTYGRELSVLSREAVRDVDEILAGVRAIVPSTNESANVFTAVRELASRAVLYRRGSDKREVVLVVFTERPAADTIELDRTIKYLRQRSIRAYVVGTAVHFGEETQLPERLPWVGWPNSEDEGPAVSAGFGPYWTTLLCVETGGLFLITKDIGDLQFNPQTMRSYAPDYSRPEQYLGRIAGSRAALATTFACARFTPSVRDDVMATALLASLVRHSDNSLGPIGLQPTELPSLSRSFRADDEAVFQGELKAAWSEAEKLLDQLDAIDAELSAAKPFRAELESTRSKANYDLAFGQVTALRGRLLGYSRHLSAMAASPMDFENADSDRWELVPANFEADPPMSELVTRARARLGRVVDEHAKTPWAAIAESELNHPFGWKWQESRSTATVDPP